jgi:cyclopropane-fatty-acyl-phospholipid synthase
MTPAMSVINRHLISCGVAINGLDPGDIIVHDDRFYNRGLFNGSLGLGESYMDGWWDCSALDIFFTKILSHEIYLKMRISVPEVMAFLTGYLTNLAKSQAYHIGKAHYDLGNDFYQTMLGNNLVYSCGYWRNAASLEEAQVAKFDLVCRKLGLRKGQKVLDIGCGWGGFARYAATNYGVSVTGITVSHEQERLAREMNRGLPVEIRYQDFREVKEVFDHIVSIGMFEHVGYKNYREYLAVVRRSLANDGLFLLHTIGSPSTTINQEPWIAKYIFPNSKLPSLKQISQAIEGLFVLEDLENFGVDYDRTLMAWHHNFETHWPEFRQTYDERFYRMWRYYLLMCAGAFRARHLQLWQIVLSPRGVPGGYRSIR